MSTQVSLGVSSSPSVKESPADSNENFVFDIADLAVEFEHNPVSGSKAFIEAFKATANDRVVEKNDPKDFSKLMWRSIGFPRLVVQTSSSSANRTGQTAGLANFLRFKSSGFTIFVEMLTEQHKRLFVDTASKRYKSEIQPSQIISLILEKFTCELSFMTEEGEEVAFHGKAVNLNEFPIRVDFRAPVLTKKRQLFMQFINSSSALDDIHIQVSNLGI